MTVSTFGRAALALGLATTLAVSVDAQRNRNGNDRSNRGDDQSDQHEVIAFFQSGNLSLFLLDGRGDGSRFFQALLHQP